VSVWLEPKGIKHKNGKVWDPTKKKTKELRDNAKAVEKQRAKDEADGKYSVGGKNSIAQQFE
jgi:hypothetical protein